MMFDNFINFLHLKNHALMAIMLCLLFLFSSFIFCFAVDADLFVPQISENSNSALRAEGAYFGKYGSSGWSGYVGCVNYDDVIYGVYSSPGSSDGLTFAVVTNHSDATIIRSNSNTSKTGVSISLYDGSEDIYTGSFYNISSSVWIDYSTVPIYESLEDMVSFFQDDVIGGGGGITNNGNAIVVVNPGNVAYIGYNSATFNFLINLDKPVSNFISNARYGFATELPSGVFTFTPSSGNVLPLRKSVPDLLGRSATWVGSVDTDTLGYFIVYNPVYDLNGYTNKPIRVTVTLGYMNVTQFPLTASDIGGDIVSTGNSDNFYISDGMQGGTDLPSYIYSNTDQNGNVTTSSALTVPVTPYNYTEPSAGSSESGLQGFLQQILDLLSAPIKHIQNLYTSAVGFFNYLSSLWSWLPFDVSTILVDALIVLVVIGVIKFLWK